MKHFLKTISLLALMTVLIGCQKVTSVNKPKNLIPEEKMIDILVDFAKVDAAISINSPEYEKRGSPGKELIFKKYDIDSVQLMESSAYYAEHFKVNQRMYETVAERLQEESDSLHEVDKKDREGNKTLKKDEEEE